jgi:hypothetical protein
MHMSKLGKRGICSPASATRGTAIVGHMSASEGCEAVWEEVKGWRIKWVDGQLDPFSCQSVPGVI